jgi:hypothetical protein
LIFCLSSTICIFYFLPRQKSTILFFSFSTAYLIFHRLYFSKIQNSKKELQKTLEKKGKLIFTFLLSAGGISPPFGSPIKGTAGHASSSHPLSI